jgi:hypothetical protein
MLSTSPNRLMANQAAMPLFVLLDLRFLSPLFRDSQDSSGYAPLWLPIVCSRTFLDRGPVLLSKFTTRLTPA